MRAALLVFLLTAPAVAQPSAGADSVWVAQAFALGVQCETSYEIPDTEAQLRAAGVASSLTAIVPGGIYTVCGAPAYVATHYARIAARDTEHAAAIGYVRSDPPTSEALDLGWYERTDTWGRQCEAPPAQAMPDPHAALRAAGVAVYGFASEPLPVCEACGICPAAAMRTRVRASAHDVVRLASVGFEPADG